MEYFEMKNRHSANHQDMSGNEEPSVPEPSDFPLEKFAHAVRAAMGPWIAASGCFGMLKRPKGVSALSLSLLNAGREAVLLESRGNEPMTTDELQGWKADVELHAKDCGEIEKAFRRAGKRGRRAR